MPVSAGGLPAPNENLSCRIMFSINLTRARTAPPHVCSLFCRLPPLSLLLPTPLVGAEIASEGLKGRVFEFSLGDLNNDEDLVSLSPSQQKNANQIHPSQALNGA